MNEITTAHPEQVCLLSGPHGAHDRVYTSSGGGHMMTTWDDSGYERDQKWWHCPGRPDAPTPTPAGDDQREALITEGRTEAQKDRRVAAQMRTERARNALMHRAYVTERLCDAMAEGPPVTAPDHTTRAVELTTQALDADQGITIRHITVAAAQVEATLAQADALDRLAEAVRGLAPRVDRPRWDDDLRAQDVHPDPVLAWDHEAAMARVRDANYPGPDGLTDAERIEKQRDAFRAGRDRLREGIRGISARLADPEAPPAHVVQQTLLALLADDETHRDPITVAGTPAEQRHAPEEK